MAGLFGVGFWWLANQKDIAVDIPGDYQSPVSGHRLFQFSDPTSTYSLADIQQFPSQQWQEVRAVNFGYKGGTGWARSDIYSPYQQTVLLELQSHFIDAVTVWLVAGTGVVKEYASTGHRELSHVSHNPLLHRYFTFELPLEAEQSYEVFIRGSTAPGFTLKYTVRYWEPAAFMGYFRGSDWGWAVFVGIILIALFIALMSFVFHGQLIYIYYAGYVSSLSLYALLNDGWGIFLSGSLHQISNPIFIAHFLNLGICFLLLFSREFLVIPRQSSQWWLHISPWWCWALITGCILLTHYGYSHHYEGLIRFGYWLGMTVVSVAGLFWTAYWWNAIQRGFSPAWLLLASQLVMFLFYGTNLFLVNINALTLAYPDMYIFRVALIIELMVIAAGWIYRQKVIRQSQRQLQAVNESQRQAVREAEHLWQKEEIKALKLENELHTQRDRLARDLHDGIGSQLSHIISRLDLLSFSPVPQAGELVRLSDFTRETNRNLRETIWILNREQIAFDDFSGRLHSFLRSVWEDRETPILHWQSNKTFENPMLPHTVALHLFRIAQEATVNALKHAKAEQVNVEIEQFASEIRLTVSDNGKGFHHDVPSSGFGLANMKKRAEEMQAIFELATGDLGTHIRVTIPLTV